LLMAIGFVYQLTGVAFACFFRVEKILEWRWVRKLAARLEVEAPIDAPGETSAGP
ncbi:MAG: hypothetical protein JRH11_21275, partial [Deltaproteobacteria bacterium]|nr:hypothetical protein [Deltaproteobacteria bacterium]